MPLLSSIDSLLVSMSSLVQICAGCGDRVRFQLFNVVLWILCVDSNSTNGYGNHVTKNVVLNVAIAAPLSAMNASLDGSRCCH